MVWPVGSIVMLAQPLMSRLQPPHAHHMRGKGIP
jgi:hypothetical protein